MVSCKQALGGAAWSTLLVVLASGLLVGCGSGLVGDGGSGQESIIVYPPEDPCGKAVETSQVSAGGGWDPKVSTYYTLSVSKSGLGSGLVTAPRPLDLDFQPTGTGGSVGDVFVPLPLIDCGARCWARLPACSWVAASATADAGSVFGDWSGVEACVGGGDFCGFYLQENTSLDAQFDSE